MVDHAHTTSFNKADRFAEGWCWALPSRALARGRTAAVRVLGRDLVLFRGQSGQVHALDAHCPHMGAHLAEGRVEGDQLRCFFHGWRYDASGRCTDVPVLPGAGGCEARVQAWPAEEKYGLVWVWTGPAAAHGLDLVPELGDRPTTASLGKPFRKECLPGVMLVNAIDEHHFATVHHLPNVLDMQPEVHDVHHISFANGNPVPTDRWIFRRARPFYDGALTYALTYWNARTGVVTLGPDFLHFYLMFALRPSDDGGTEGQMVAITPTRRGVLGWAADRVLLLATKLVSAYFARGDTRVFQTIRFDLRHPIRADKAIVKFIQHAEAQPTRLWGTWEPAP